MKQLIILFVFFQLANLTFAQNCNCSSNFEWVKKTFEDNDAGFQYAIDRKGKFAYEAHKQDFAQKVKKIKDPILCQKTLVEFLNFFRSGHLEIYPIEPENTNQNPQNKQITLAKWETIAIDVPDFEKYLATKKEMDFEGVWETGSYTIGIKKQSSSYKGFIIKSANENWKEKEIKLEINLDKKNAIYFMGDRSSVKTSNLQLIENKYLQINKIRLKRVLPKVEVAENIEQYFKIMDTEKPFIISLNTTTLLFRIPTFGDSKVEIDSLIAANKDKITSTENLIIDIRNNGGGNDRNYKEILPFLYTNPIKVVGMTMLSTKLNNQRMMDFITDPKYGFDEKEKKEFKTNYDTLQKHIGEFVDLDGIKISTEKLDKIYAYPKNVGIIINEKNGSTAEQFLLAAKQSKKVKLFGSTTAGVLDISNMYFIKSPCKEFYLGYSLSKSYRIPDMAIDGKGIMPDYYLDKEIKDYDWIEYVSKILNQK